MAHQYRFGIIGTGGRGVGALGMALRRRPQEAVIVALADTNRLRLDAAARILGGVPHVYQDYRQLLAMDDVDVVIIATPDATHDEIAVRAFEAGKHVLCEKPLHTTVAGCRAIIEASRRADRVLEVGHVLRYMLFYEKLRQVVQSGVLGRIHHLEAADCYRGGASYFRRWNRFRELSGGLLVHKGCHTFDILNWITERQPRRVAAFAGLDVFREGPDHGERCLTCENRCEFYTDISQGMIRQLFLDAEQEDGYVRDVCVYNSDKDTFDDAQVVIEYDGRIRALYSQCFYSATTTRRFRIIGDKAELSADEQARVIEVIRGDDGQTIRHDVGPGPPGHLEGDERQIQRLLDSMRTGNALLADGEAALLSVAVGVAAETAARQGRVVSLDECL